MKVIKFMRVSQFHFLLGAFGDSWHKNTNEDAVCEHRGAETFAALLFPLIQSSVVDKNGDEL